MRVLIIILLSFLLLQCNDKKDSTEVEDKTSETITTPSNTISSTPVAKQIYPSIPKEKMLTLWDDCNNIDLIIIDQPFSVSTNDNQQSRALLRHIAVDSTAIYQDCSKVATISYVGNAGILMDAELYFSLTKDHCNYFIFYEEGKPTYANMMTQEGYDYYKQLFSNVQVQTQK